jgi:hypothetical protein
MGAPRRPFDPSKAKISKDLRPIVRAAMDQGWTMTASGKHLKLTSPDGSHSEPIPGRAHGPLLKAIKHRLRKHGVEGA